MTTTPPHEPEGGQDDGPDVLTAVRAVLGLLADIREHLEQRPAETADLRDRIGAHRHALIRLRNRIENGGP